MPHLRLETRHAIWRLPRHHLNIKESHDHVQWIELFYDLVHVVAIFILGNYLSHHLSVDGVFVFGALFTIMWFAWYDSTVFNSLYVSTDIYHRLIMTSLIITVMLMSSAIPQITHGGWVFFAMAFAINRAIIAYMYWRVRYNYYVENEHEHCHDRLKNIEIKMPREMARNYLVIAVIYTISAFLPGTLGYALFATTFLIQLLAFTLPRFGITRYNSFIPRFGHLSERFALLFLIVSGEGFFKLVLSLSEKGIYKVTPDVFANYIFGAFTIFVMCWVYYDSVANAKPKDDSNKTFIIWTFAHLFLMISAVMVGVAVSAEVKVGFMQPYPLYYGALGCAGMAGYMLFLWVIQTQITPHPAHQYMPAKLRLIGIVLSGGVYFILPYVPSIVGNIIWGGSLFLQVVYPTVVSVRDYNRNNKW